MPHSRILFVLLLITVIVTAENEGTVIESHYEESLSYSQNPQCKPSILDKGIQCTDVGPAFEVQGGLVSPVEALFYFIDFNEMFLGKVFEFWALSRPSRISILYRTICRRLGLPKSLSNEHYIP